VVVAEDPDVITLQEVRLDTAFASPDSKFSHWVYDSNGMT
jgi:exonuclease III